MSQPVKCRVHSLPRFPLPQIRRIMALGSKVVQVLRATQRLEKLDHPRVPAACVTCQFFQYGRSPLPPPIRDGVRDFRAKTDARGSFIMPDGMPDQIGE